MTIRVLVADDQDLVRTGLRLILGTLDGIEVVGEARDGQEAVRLARQPMGGSLTSCPMLAASPIAIVLNLMN